MTRTEILEELQKLPMAERLAIAKATLRLIRDELRKAEPALAGATKAEQLAAAAEALLPDYSGGSELTIFTRAER